MNFENLLIEIGTEELPPKSLIKLASNFAQGIESSLKEADIDYSDVIWFATPRRLAVNVKQLASMQKDRLIEKRGPAVTAAFDSEGNATPAALGWARSNNVNIEDVGRLKTDKGEWLFYQGSEKGQSITQLLPGIVEAALISLPIPKPMRWGSNSIQFIRPIHTITMLFGSELVAGNVFGIDSSRMVLGHRFLGDKRFSLAHADEYLTQLKRHFVLADYVERKEYIRKEVNALAASENATADMNEDLLDEVTALVEWPVAMTASFDESFLEVPKEALIYTMKGDQKYFPLIDDNGLLLARFIFISNIETKYPDLIVSGNEKVIRPRLADAQFFYASDKKHTLESRLASLDTILFQKQLGTLLDKSKRISTLSGLIAKTLHQDEVSASRAGLLSKTDLMTNMVMEFPDVQGIMGMYYAKLDGESVEVANALNEQYKPRFSGDSLPLTPISIAVALADKIDTLVGIFGIGQIPKGDKDPFALRRAAIGVLRIIIESKLALDLNDLVENSIAAFGDKVKTQDLKTNVVDFILARFKALYLEQGIGVDVIQAVLEIRPTYPAEFAARIEAINQFKTNDAAEALAAANKRVANILAKNPISAANTINIDLLTEDAEVRLVEALNTAQTEVEGFTDASDYTNALNVLATLRGPIDSFFDSVMVMVDDPAVRMNRLSILLKLRSLFLTCGDISLLS
ncbi:glycine--tRNA ligase subunit beta [Flavobacterium sp. W21_SRS_FM6]|uniref:glycine--tRNA ligase subunit beta n=1 Tax=Flavobacterium sp. W21_SRS_FM6 TaxID=3240268 RepID=UPI003F8FAEFA